MYYQTIHKIQYIKASIQTLIIYGIFIQPTVIHTEIDQLYKITHTRKLVIKSV